MHGKIKRKEKITLQRHLDSAVQNTIDISRKNQCIILDLSYQAIDFWNTVPTHVNKKSNDFPIHDSS